MQPSKDSSPEVYFCSHLDTVAPYVEFDEDEEFLYGRGACDTKGVIAAMIGAWKNLLDNGIETGFLFTVGEELDSIGAKAANENPASSVKYTIVGEPTENKLVAGQKGLYLVKVTTDGTSAHSAYPHLGESAVTKLLDILERLRATDLPVHEKRGETTVNISQLEGGDRFNVIPDSASVGLMFRVSTSLEEIKSLIVDIIGGDGQIEVINQCGPQQMVEIPGYANEIVAYSTDIPFLPNWGEPLLFGPGSIHDAHTLEEKIRKEDILTAVEHYQDIVRYLMN
ncbi:MAG: Acetylornithine deacetylase [Candidatus Marinimicrobia bacterium]|nr:Acetylornithine deacetylase [Candidatus Neomarinimicrobiota bacterium]